LTARPTRANIEHVFLQGSLFGTCDVDLDDSFGGMERIALDHGSWVDHLPGWLRGDDLVFDELHQALPWRQRRGVQMYDSLVDEPRLTSWWHESGGVPEPLPVLADARAALTRHYGLHFDSIGFNLYRDGHDSVAWHGDRHRHTVVDPVVAIVSVGAARPLRLRPRGGGPSLTWNLGRGDLFVMGGSCQHDWEHAVPKMSVAGPRISITYRHGVERFSERTPSSRRRTP
jgi:alkylated DNA repair dioxygenase AlkB